MLPFPPRYGLGRHIRYFVLRHANHFSKWVRVGSDFEDPLSEFLSFFIVFVFEVHSNYINNNVYKIMNIKRLFYQEERVYFLQGRL